METNTLHVERVFDAPREKVWDALTNSESVKKWWGPKEFSCPVAQIDLKVGGKYLYCMRGAMASGMPKQDFYSGGEYTEIVPMEKIAMTDHFTDSSGNVINPKDTGMPGEWPKEMRVTIELSDAGEGKTKVAITHEGHPSEIADNATQGWNQQLDKFAAIL